MNVASFDSTKRPMEEMLRDPTGRGHEDDEERTRRVLYDCKRISYWIDRRLTGLAGPDYDAPISVGAALLNLKTANMGNPG